MLNFLEPFQLGPSWSSLEERWKENHLQEKMKKMTSKEERKLFPRKKENHLQGRNGEDVELSEEEISFVIPVSTIPLTILQLGEHQSKCNKYITHLLQIYNTYAINI